MLDRGTFVRPIAHRGLHAKSRGIIENSAPAFEAAIAGGYGIECDLQPASDGRPMVFHDEALGRLVDAKGLVSEHKATALGRLSYRDSATPARILRLGELLELTAGRVPLLIEIKSSWRKPAAGFLKAIAAEVALYKGPAAVMSFDPDIVAQMKTLLPDRPRGIVSGVYGDGWAPAHVDSERRYRLTHLIESGPAAPDFFAYRVRDLPTPVTRFLREGLEIPLFTWTVRTAEDVETARAWADAPIFEDVDPNA